MVKEIEELKELIGTKVITRMDTERTSGGLGGYHPLIFKVLEKTYKAPKEVIDEINDGIIKGDTIKIKKLENDLVLNGNRINVLENKVRNLKKSLRISEEWKNLSLFRRIFKKPLDKESRG
jgi:hypothetical protein